MLFIRNSRRTSARFSKKHFPASVSVSSRVGSGKIGFQFISPRPFRTINVSPYLILCFAQ